MKLSQIMIVALLVFSIGCSKATITPRGGGTLPLAPPKPLPRLDTINRGPTVALVIIAAEQQVPALDYLDLPKLQFVVSDAQKLKKVFISEFGLPTANVCILANEKATRAAVSEQLEALSTRLQKNDTAVIAFLGHGIGGSEAQLVLYDEVALASECLGKLGALPSERVLLLLDACRSGNPNGEPFSLNAQHLRRDGELCFLSSADSEELAYESSELQAGVFTYFLSEALAAPDALDRDRDGWLNLVEIGEVVGEKVSEYVTTVHGQETGQTPQFESWRMRNDDKLLPIPKRWGVRVNQPAQIALTSVLVPPTLPDGNAAWLLVFPEAMNGEYWPQMRVDSGAEEATVHLGADARHVDQWFRVVLVEVDAAQDRIFSEAKANVAPMIDQSGYKVRAETRVQRTH